MPPIQRQNAKGEAGPETHRRYGEIEDRPRRIRARIFGLLAIGLGTVYVALLPFNLNPETPLAGWAFVAAEISCLLLLAVATSSVWRLRFKPPEGLPARVLPSVDVFITVCGEPLAVIDRSLASAARLSYPGKLSVYVLDDDNDPRVAARAAELGFTYRSRIAEGQPRRCRKAGNLNYGLERSSGEFVFTLDADHEVDETGFAPLLGYMRFPEVGFVQSKQRFVVQEDDPFNAQDPVFYDGIQLAFDDSDTVISCGSGVLYRRRALDDVDGFAEWNLVEDLTTSYELHARGWKTLYFPYAITKGLAPANIHEVYRQRGQWATDTLRLFFWDNPMLKRGLSWRARFRHLMISLTYLWAGFLVPIFFVLPLYAYVTGQNLFTSNEGLIFAARAAYFGLFVVAVRSLFRGRSVGKQFQFLVGLFPVYIAGAFRALFHPKRRDLAYKVNNTGDAEVAEPAPFRTWLALVPQLALFGANAVLPFYALWFRTAGPWTILINVGVSAFVLWTLWPVIVAGLTHRSHAIAVAGLRTREAAA